MPLTTPPKAYLFDVFGTVVNWRHSLAQHLQSLAAKALASPSPATNPSVLLHAAAFTYTHWEALASEWYHLYITHALDSSKSATKTTYLTPEDLWLSLLTDRVLPRWNLIGLFDDKTLADMPYLWHDLAAWPDSASSITALKTFGPCATLSDGSVKLLSNLAAKNGLEWSAVYGSDTWGAYKPDPAVYLGGVRKVGDILGQELRPDEVALVAAHLPDLKGAKKAGLKAIYLERPDEERMSRGEVEVAKREGWVDLWVDVGGGGLAGVVRELGNIRGAS